MTVLTAVTDGIGGVLSVLLPFLFVLTVVVFIHELGHFLVARWCKVKVTAFSIGFGPEICHFVDRHGTRWRLAWIPLGGYVKFMDDENGASVPSREAIDRMTPEQQAGSFHAKPVWQRAAVVVAGPIANFLLAIAIFTGMYMVKGIHITAPKIQEVLPASPAEAAGFKAGDVILQIDGSAITSFTDVVRVVAVSPEQALSFKVDRDGRELTLIATPALHEEKDRMGGTMRRGMIGIRPMATPQTRQIQSVGPIDAVGLAFKETKFIITSTLGYIRDVVVGRQKADQLGGPIRIAEVSSQFAKVGMDALLHILALISVSVGLINLFPIPLMDGGHLMFYAIEVIRGRQLSERSQEIGFKIGLAVVLALMLFSTWNDRLILWHWITGAS